MDDPEILKLLGLLGLDGASARVLALLPLVRVAWADGEVQDEERELILAQARDRWPLNDDAAMVLRNWLTWPPSDRTLRRGQMAIRACVVRAGDPDFGPELVADVLDLARRVARAAGGLWGLGAVSRDESQALAEVATALRIPEGARWEHVRAQLEQSLDAEPPRTRVILRVDADSLDLGGPLTAVLRDVWGDTEIPLSGRMVLGRGAEAQVQLSHPSVAAAHCALTVHDDGRVVVEALDPDAPTRVDDDRVLARRLLGGEALTLGEVKLLFHFVRRVPGQLMG